MSPAQVELEEHPEAAVVRVRASLDAAVTGQLRTVLARAAEAHPHLVVDLAGVPMLDTAALGALVRAHRAARRHDGTVCLAGASRVVITVLHTMHVDGLFPLFDDCAEALDWLRTSQVATA
ncbi:STAS domain-containing protein [Symbioplanes lichenis]|uniref:STAS domain-containing protein n=1 Tax=Symbioplanes lichenis TaxID=1629072 RepID=UPI00273A001C|nr:STAS domain-containing protein [Actinoplanes lichenis]